VFTLNNDTHRNTITEADYFIAHITKKTYCQNLTKWETIATNQHSGMVHEEHKGWGKTKYNISTFSEVCQVYS